MSLYFTSIPALKGFGLWTGIGILLNFLVILLLTPGLLYLFPLSGKQATQAKSFSTLNGLFLWILKHRRLVLSAFFWCDSISRDIRWAA
ncbi:MMPL family transporter [Algoriphagus boritolerans]|uniref:MMPL family transporter n=1 Tax=Algoriphagus boritolerans TaxID=308111 RepID=UPI002FCE6664